MPTVAPNNLFACEVQLWSLAIAWPALSQVVAPRTVPLLKLGNLERFDQLKIPWPHAKTAGRPSDSVMFNLDVGTGRPDPRAPRTFCNQPDIAIVNFEWTLTANTKQLMDITQAMAELRACMITAGTQLGIPAIVAKWEGSFRPGRPDVKERQIIYSMAITIKG